MKSSKKILGASAALGLAVALSAGSTFAWFTAGKTDVKVDSFDLTATTETDGADLKIAVGLVNDADGVNIALGDDMYGYSAAVADENAAEGSIAYKLNALTQQELKAVSYDSGFVDKNDSPVTGGYITFRIVFQSTKPLNIYLADAASVKPSGNSTPIDGAEEPVADAIIKGLGNGNYGKVGDGYTGTDGENCTITARAANAARVLFADKKAGGTDKIWCPNEYNYNGSQVAEDAAEASKENPNAAGFWKGNLAGDYVYAVNEIRDGKTFDEVLLKDVAASEGVAAFTRPTDTIVTQKTYTNCVKPFSATGKTLLTTLAKADQFNSLTYKTEKTGSDLKYITGTLYYGVLDVSIWLEGTDGDCFDAILGDAMSVVLAFKGEESTQSGS